LTATDVEAQIDGFSEYQIIPNSPPLPGSLSVSPTEGLASNTSFTLTATSWSDSDGDVTYQFYYLMPGQTDMNYLSANQPNAQITVTFPVAGNMTVFVRVFDIYNAYTDYQFPSTVTIDKYIPPDASAFIDSLIAEIQDLLDAGDKSDAKIKITNLAQIINDPDTSLTSDERNSYTSTVFNLLTDAQDSVITAESATLQMQAVSELAKGGGLDAQAQQAAIDYITTALQNLTESLPQSAVDDTISVSFMNCNILTKKAFQLYYFWQYYCK
jgi:hypothetical protein